MGDTDSDGDMLNDYEENLLGTDPEDADTNGDGIDDGSEFLQGDNPNDKRPQGQPMVAEIESRWIHHTISQEVYIFQGGMMTINDLHAPDSNEGPDWVTSRTEYPTLASATTFSELSAAAAAFPLPTEWQPGFKGLWWIHQREDSYFLPAGLKTPPPAACPTA